MIRPYWLYRFAQIGCLFQATRSFSLKTFPHSPTTTFQLFDREFYVKRDDTLRLLPSKNINGNKTRKLKHFISGDRNPPTCLISYGGSQSNAMRALAETAVYLQCNFVYFCRSIPKFLSSSPFGNLQDALEAGMQLIELSAAEYRVVESMHTSEDLWKSDLMKQERVKSVFDSADLAEPCFVPQGGAMSAAKEGIFDLCKELEIFMEDRKHPVKPWKIYFASGTGTMALFAAQYFHTIRQQKSPTNSVEIVAIPCMGDEHILLQNMVALDKRCDALTVFPAILPTNLAPPHMFGQPSIRHYEIWQRLQASTGCDFDLLYAPRAFEIMLSCAADSSQSLGGFEDDVNVLYYHCGGVEGNRSQLQRYKYLKLIPS